LSAAFPRIQSRLAASILEHILLRGLKKSSLKADYKAQKYFITILDT
jgi:hypothetical protein